MCADIFQQDMEVDENEQASLLGAVVLAKERLGVIADIRRFDPPCSRVIYHDPQKAELYKSKYQRYMLYYNK